MRMDFLGVDRSLRRNHPYLRGDTWYLYTGEEIIVLSGDDFGRIMRSELTLSGHRAEALSNSISYAESLEIN